MKKLLVENLSENLTIIQKMDFSSIDCVFDSLNFAFHPDGIGDEEPDPRFLALWTLFLSSVGWTEDQYWDEVNFHRENCPHCSDQKNSEEKVLNKDIKAN